MNDVQARYSENDFWAPDDDDDNDDDDYDDDDDKHFICIP